jgi:hypothetical protein
MGLPAHKLDEFPDSLDYELVFVADVDEYVPRHRGELIDEEAEDAESPELSLPPAPVAQDGTPSETQPLKRYAETLPRLRRANLHPIRRTKRLGAYAVGKVNDAYLATTGATEMDGFDKASVVGLVVAGLALGGVLIHGSDKPQDSELRLTPSITLKTTPRANTLREVIERYGNHHGWTKKQEHKASEYLANGFSAQGWVKIPADQSVSGKSVTYKTGLVYDTQKLVPNTKVRIDGGSFAGIVPPFHTLDHPGF